MDIKLIISKKGDVTPMVCTLRRTSGGELRWIPVEYAYPEHRDIPHLQERRRLKHERDDRIMPENWLAYNYFEFYPSDLEAFGGTT